jgi:hypothetical protein
MAPYEALYGRPCRSPVYWDDVCKPNVESPMVVQHYTDHAWVIRDHLCITQSSQKSYAYCHYRELTFEVNDFVFIKISLTREYFILVGRVNSIWYMLIFSRSWKGLQSSLSRRVTTSVLVDSWYISCIHDEEVCSQPLSYHLVRGCRYSGGSVYYWEADSDYWQKREGSANQNHFLCQSAMAASQYRGVYLRTQSGYVKKVPPVIWKRVKIFRTKLGRM